MKSKKNNLFLCIENGLNSTQTDFNKNSLFSESRRSSRKPDTNNTISDFNERSSPKDQETTRYLLNTIYNKSMQLRNCRLIKGLALSSKRKRIPLSQNFCSKKALGPTSVDKSYFKLHVNINIPEQNIKSGFQWNENLNESRAADGTTQTDFAEFKDETFNLFQFRDKRRNIHSKQSEQRWVRMF